jgi:hypothetical protein
VGVGSRGQARRHELPLGDHDTLVDGVEQLAVGLRDVCRLPGVRHRAEPDPTTNLAGAAYLALVCALSSRPWTVGKTFTPTPGTVVSCEPPSPSPSAGGGSLSRWLDLLDPDRLGHLAPGSILLPPLPR